MQIQSHKGDRMLSYAEIEKLETDTPHFPLETEFCAMCGKKLWLMTFHKNEYDYKYCKKCRVIKTLISD